MYYNHLTAILLYFNMNINLKEYLAKGLPYSIYLERFEHTIEQNKDLPAEQQIYNFKYYGLNWQRSTRIYKQYQVTQEVLTAINNLQAPLHWLVITEPWCGDSAQNLPVIAKVAEASNGKIQLLLVYRDENPELMDQFLTNGGRAIPKLIQLDAELNVLATWGPRPQTAQTLVMQLKAANVPHDEYTTTLYKWYADNKGNDLSKELIQLINTK